MDPYDGVLIQSPCQVVRRLEERESHIQTNIRRITDLIGFLFHRIGEVKLAVTGEYSLFGQYRPRSTEEWIEIALPIPNFATDLLGETARKFEIYLVGHFLERHPEFPGRYFNTTVIIDPRGEIVLTYRKHNGPNNLNTTYTGPGDVYRRFIEVFGEEALFPVVDTPIGRLGVLVCGDIQYPEVARTLQPFLSKYLNAPVVIENVAGAGGKVGRNQVYKAKPDGYTLVLTGVPAPMISQKMDNPGYKMEEMTPIYNITGGDYNYLAVPYDSPLKTLEDLKNLGKQKSIKVSGSGIGNNSYLAFVLLKEKVRLNVKYIPFDSGTEAALAVISKQVDMATGSVVSFSPLAEQKRIRVIAGFGPKRHDSFTEVPTLVELGYRDVGFDISLGILGPPRMPEDIAKALESATAKAVADPAFVAIARRSDFTLAPASAGEFRRMILESSKMVEEMLPALKAGMD
ncbi:MAG: hypothetical protein HYY65_01405 [Candidatus Tectomicrobia bacterium]|uniref:CN hydrolase domain-containing protein n=1 Tax=Tectimicrobiota bacterium TaxID=2528274 RepID=A0A932LYZ8_UNCTE|nr:hypothetical protein [Candidatus Tectomicrobia bacterium]